MTSWARSRRLVVAAVFVAVGATGCASSGPAGSGTSPAVTRHFRGLPKGVIVPRANLRPVSQPPFVVRAEHRSIYVMTWGSGSCPNLPTSVRAASAHVVVIGTADDRGPGGACTADLAVTTSVVRLPVGVRYADALVVRVDRSSSRLPRATR